MKDIKNKDVRAYIDNKLKYIRVLAVIWTILIVLGAGSSMYRNYRYESYMKEVEKLQQEERILLKVLKDKVSKM
ncbi:MAG: hypothetical protein RR782_07590 [Clostridium sp.]